MSGYISSRGRAPRIDFADTLLGGLASDGGLYLPEAWPSLPTDLGDSYAEVAASVMAPFVVPFSKTVAPMRVSPVLPSEITPFTFPWPHTQSTEQQTPKKVPMSFLALKTSSSFIIARYVHGSTKVRESLFLA